MRYKGRFKPKNRDKYLGDITNIIYRSGLELAVMFWCDKQDGVIAWCSEDIVIPYLCPTDNRIHQYFVDFLIKFSNDQIVIVEVKPYRQTLEPILKTKKPGRRYLKETYTYIKNQAKWAAARDYAKFKGWTFEIWTESQLKERGIKVIGQFDAKSK